MLDVSNKFYYKNISNLTLSLISLTILLPITNYQLPITNYQLPITNYQLPITNYQLGKLYSKTFSHKWSSFSFYDLKGILAFFRQRIKMRVPP